MNTEKLYYTDVNLRQFEAEVLSCEQVKSGWEIILDRTAFYPEGGGQPADRGLLNDVPVLHVSERGESIVHLCENDIAAGTAVHGEIDWKRRFDHMQQHSGEHIVSGMICAEFDCDNTGFHMGEDIVTIDYNKTITWEQLLEVEARANSYIWENHLFEAIWPDTEELRSIDYRSKKELDGPVRITRFPGADCCACCGTHVVNSGQVGLVKFLSVQNFRDGVRIELLCGERAYRYLSESWTQNLAIARELSTGVQKSYAAFEKLKKEQLAQKIRTDKLEETVIELRAKQYADRGNVLLIEEPMEGEMPRKLCDRIADSSKGRCMLFAGAGASYRYVVIHKGEDIRDLIKAMNAALNGRGGGKDGFAQGSVQADAIAIRQYCETL